jgi:hypothetical protein
MPPIADETWTSFLPVPHLRRRSIVEVLETLARVAVHAGVVDHQVDRPVAQHAGERRDASAVADINRVDPRTEGL